MTTERYYHLVSEVLNAHQGKVVLGSIEQKRP